MKDSIGQKDGMGWGKGNLARPWEAKQRKDLQFPAHEKLPLPGQGGLRAKCTESRGTSRGQSKWRQQVETVASLKKEDMLPATEEECVASEWSWSPQSQPSAEPALRGASSFILSPDLRFVIPASSCICPSKDPDSSTSHLGQELSGAENGW